MIQNCFFLSHQNESAPVVQRLALELQVRGIVPWVDKLPGGFAAGDGSIEEARRVIREEASAFLLYLTEKALASTFIRDIEIPEALARRVRQPDFPIFVASPQYGFREIGDLTQEHYGYNLASFHGYSLDTKSGEREEDFLVRVARASLDTHLDTQAPPNRERIEIQVSSRELMQGTADELLRVDATRLLGGAADNPEAWERLLVGLQDVKQRVAAKYGRPRLVVNGSKHFTSAFMTGRVFNRFPLEIRQTATDSWRSDGDTDALEGFSIGYEPGSYKARTLVVELATGEKDTRSGVDVLIAAGELVIGGRLVLRPVAGKVNLNERISRSLAHFVYGHIDHAVNVKKTDAVHLFVAAPQAFLMTLATLFQGMPEVQLYEWSGTEYRRTAVIPSNA